jgi:hypothetical protein
MFTSGAVGMKAVLPVSWRVLRTGGVVVVGDASYGAA